MEDVKTPSINTAKVMLIMRPWFVIVTGFYLQLFYNLQLTFDCFAFFSTTKLIPKPNWLQPKTALLQISLTINYYYLLICEDLKKNVTARHPLFYLKQIGYQI